MSGFLEVQTPMMNTCIAFREATVKPFKTYDYNELNTGVAPDLYHRMLAVGAFERVYEIIIGKVFSNKGMYILSYCWHNNTSVKLCTQTQNPLLVNLLCHTLTTEI